MTENIIQGIQRQLKRLREDVIPVYETIPTGIFAITIMRQSISNAEQAIARGDLLAMLAAYGDLEGYKL